MAEEGVGAWLFPEERSPRYISQNFIIEDNLPNRVDEAFFLEQLKAYGYAVDLSKVFLKIKVLFLRLRGIFRETWTLSIIARQNSLNRICFGSGD